MFNLIDLARVFDLSKILYYGFNGIYGSGISKVLLETRRIYQYLLQL